MVLNTAPEQRYESLVRRLLDRTERGRGSSKGKGSSRGSKIISLPRFSRIRDRHHSSNSQEAAAGNTMDLMMGQSLT